MLDILLHACAQTSAVVVLRALPFVAYVAFSKDTSRGVRWAALSALSALATASWLHEWRVLQTLILGTELLVYFSTLALGTHWLATRLDREALSRPLLLLAFAGAYVFLPGVLLPGSLGFTAQLLGWEMMFSSYSYVLDAQRGRLSESGSWRDALFFIIVDPTLVYPERGQRSDEPPAARMNGALRCALGGAALLFHNALFDAMDAGLLLRPLPLDQATHAAGYLLFVGYYALRFAAGYAVHSGLASIQIGMMRLVGYSVPERYHYPFLAKDIPDFWRRWNTYVGAWARRYVFTPIALKMRRSLRSTSPVAARGVAVLATFAVMGAAHDFIHLTEHRVLLPATLLFVLHGLLLIATVGAGSLSRTSHAPVRLLMPVASRVVLWHALVLSLWLAIPTMSGEGFGAPVAELERLVGSHEHAGAR